MQGQQETKHVDAIKILSEYVSPDSETFYLLVIHSTLVTHKALQIAKQVPELHPDLEFIKQAAMLHDIGICKVYAPNLGCHGEHTYIEHGHLGRQILESLGLSRHALVAERHTCLTLSQIQDEQLPIPHREMIPQTVEEEIIALADKFYSKRKASVFEEKTKEQIYAELKKYGSSITGYLDYLFAKYKQ